VAFLLSSLLAEDNLRFGQSACAASVLGKKFFVVCYDAAHKIPAWVCHALTKHGVNGGEWAQLEGAVHGLAAANGTVCFFSGPVFAGKTPKTIGPDKVAVLTHTYKVALLVGPNGNKDTFAFVLAEYRQAERHDQ